MRSRFNHKYFNDLGSHLLSFSFSFVLVFAATTLLSISLSLQTKGESVTEFERLLYAMDGRTGDCLHLGSGKTVEREPEMIVGVVQKHVISQIQKAKKW